MPMTNFYDAPTPALSLDAVEKRRFVSLHIYTFPDVPVDDDLTKKIRGQVEVAAEIWCNKCSIEVYASTFDPLAEKVPGDLSLDTENTDTANGLPAGIRDLLLTDNSYRPHCLDSEIAVYYVKGKTFKSGSTGYAWWSQTSSGTRHSIIMTEGGSGEVLAHEIGHHLFVRPRPDDPTRYFDDNPEIAFMDLGVKGHDTRPSYLMNSPTNNGETNVSPLQCATITRECKLLKIEDARVGWDPPTGAVRRCVVVFEKMYVFHSSDETGGPHLESSWDFHAYEETPTGGRTAQKFHATWDESDLFGPKEFDLRWMGPATVYLGTVTNNLGLLVAGNDTDGPFSSDDRLPTISIMYTAADNWGHGPHTERGDNEEMMYDLYYSIQSDTVSQTRFRRCQATVGK